MRPLRRILLIVLAAVLVAPGAALAADPPALSGSVTFTRAGADGLGATADYTVTYAFAAARPREDASGYPFPATVSASGSEALPPEACGPRSRSVSRVTQPAAEVVLSGFAPGTSPDGLAIEAVFARRDAEVELLTRNPPCVVPESSTQVSPAASLLVGFADIGLPRAPVRFARQADGTFRAAGEAADGTRRVRWDLTLAFPNADPAPDVGVNAASRIVRGVTTLRLSPAFRAAMRRARVAIRAIPPATVSGGVVTMPFAKDGPLTILRGTAWARDDVRDVDGRCYRRPSDLAFRVHHAGGFELRTRGPSRLTPAFRRLPLDVAVVSAGGGGDQRGEGFFGMRDTRDRRVARGPGGVTKGRGAIGGQLQRDLIEDLKTTELAPNRFRVTGARVTLYGTPLLLGGSEERRLPLGTLEFDVTYASGGCAVLADGPAAPDPEIPSPGPGKKRPRG